MVELGTGREFEALLKTLGGLQDLGVEIEGTPKAGRVNQGQKRTRFDSSASPEQEDDEQTIKQRVRLNVGHKGRASDSSKPSSFADLQDNPPKYIEFLKSLEGLLEFPEVDKSSGLSEGFKNLLAQYGIPAVCGALGTFLGLPPSVSFGIGSALNPLSKSGSSSNNEDARLERMKVLIGNATSVINGGVTDIVTSLLSNVTSLANTTIGEVPQILSFGREVVGDVVNGVKDFVNWYERHPTEMMKRMMEVNEISSQMVSMVFESQERTRKKRREVSDMRKEGALYLKEVADWEEIVKRVSELWENYFKTVFENPELDFKEVTEAFKQRLEEVQADYPQPIDPDGLDDGYIDIAKSLMAVFFRATQRYISLFKPYTSGSWNLGRSWQYKTAYLPFHKWKWSPPFVVYKKLMEDRIIKPLMTMANDKLNGAEVGSYNLPARSAKKVGEKDAESTHFTSLYGYGRKKMVRKKGKGKRKGKGRKKNIEADIIRLSEGLYV